MFEIDSKIACCIQYWTTQHGIAKKDGNRYEAIRIFKIVQELENIARIKDHTQNQKDRIACLCKNCGTVSDNTTNITPNNQLAIGKGYYLFGNWYPPMNTPPLSSSLVHCRTICRTWATFNPAIGVYDFSTLTTDISNCIAAGKKFAIKIRAGVDSPMWLQSIGVPYHTFTEIEHIGTSSAMTVNYNLPIFYNPIYKQAWKDFVTALCNHLKSNIVWMDNLEFLSVNGINRESAEVRIPYLVDATHGINNVAVWLSLGYTSQIAIDTFKEFYNHLDAEIGGNKPIVTPIVPRRFPNVGDGVDVLVEITKWLSNNKEKNYIQDTFVNETFNGQSIDNLAKSLGMKIIGQLATINFRNNSTKNAELLLALQKFIDYGGYPVMEIYESNIVDYVPELTNKKPLYQ